jgi:hypothetical protein
MSNILWNGRVILLAVVVAIIPLFLSVVFTKPKQTEVSFPRPEHQLFPMATEIFGVKIEKNPPESRLNELGVRTWPTYATLKPLPFIVYCFFFFCLFLLLKFVGFVIPECLANIVLKNLGF